MKYVYMCLYDLNNLNPCIIYIMTGAACVAGNAYPFGAPDFISGSHSGSLLFCHLW